VGVVGDRCFRATGIAGKEVDVFSDLGTGRGDRARAAERRQAEAEAKLARLQQAYDSLLPEITDLRKKVLGTELLQRLLDTRTQSVISLQAINTKIHKDISNLQIDLQRANQELDRLRSQSGSDDTGKLLTELESII
jgi:chromosome segregation ATPase